MRRSSILEGLASPRLTVAFFLAMAAAAIAAAHNPADITALVLLPLGLLIANLVAAILSNARFRADLPLLVFHLALLAFVVLLAVARLCYFDGAVKLTTGEVFEGNYLVSERGRLHPGHPEALRFSHEGLVEYTPDGSDYATTYTRVQWWDQAGRPHLNEISNDRPLVLDGYRLFATRQRGYSPVFHFTPTGMPAPLHGTAQLADNYLDEGVRNFTVGTDLVLPDGHTIWVQAILEESYANRAGIARDLGAGALRHHLVVRDGDARYELRPGDSVDLAGGRFTYDHLSTWLGYRIVYDPTPAWLAAAVITAIASLCAFYARLWMRRRRGAPATLREVLA